MTTREFAAAAPRASGSARIWWEAARPRTLTASVVPVAVGLALAPPESMVAIGIAALTFACALAIQVAVNFANDVHDAEGGIDTAERAGPRRAVQAGLLSAAEMRRAFVGVLLFAVALGIPLVFRGGLPIVFVGVASLFCAWAYSGGPRPLASLGLGDAFVFVFFGVFPVAGTVWLQRLSVTWPDVLASIPIALLAVAILVVNNLRDIATDAAAGKRTLAVRIGDAATRRQYALFVAAAALWPIVLAAHFGPQVLVALLALPAAHRAIGEVRTRRGADLNASLATTARLQLLFAALLIVGLTQLPLRIAAFFGVVSGPA